MSSLHKNILKLGLFPFLVYLANNAIETFAQSFYLIYSVDTLSHFLGGLSIAYSANYALSLMEKKNWIHIKKTILRIGIIVSTVMTFAVLWEFYEFTSDQFLGTAMQPNSADLIKDLSMGMLGAIIFCVARSYRTNKKLFS